MATTQIEIVVSQNGSEVLRQVLPPGEYIVGQSPEANVIIEGRDISARHARLTIEDDAIFIEDLGSLDGTFVNGLSVRDNTRVWPSQEIRIGNATIEPHLLSDAPPVSDPAATVSGLVSQEVVVERKYDIEKILRRDEEGAILDTHDSAIRRDLAMRVLLPGSSEEDVAQFVEETQITGQLEHPNIPPIHELGTDEEGRQYCTMKVVRGVTLCKIVEIIRAKQPDALRKYTLRSLMVILQKVCDAVAFAHSKGILHLDLRPENINVGDHGEVLVMNWALARRADATAEMTASDHRAFGTSPYFAPEQARGEASQLDVRSDTYGLGAILYEVLSLRPPLLEPSAEIATPLIAEGKTDRLDIGQKYPHLPHERIPDPLVAMVAKAMATDPKNRYQTVADLQADLEAYHNLTITEAEQIGPIRQFFFVVRRYKTVSMAAAIVVGASLFFGAAAVLDDLRARRSEAKAKEFVANLKSKGPELLQLAKNEADAQQFDRALKNIETSLAIEPNQPHAYWERAWALLGQEKWVDATAALQAARDKDATGGNLARVLPAVDKMKTLSADPQRWRNEAAQEVLRYLQSAGASGPAFALAEKMQANAEVRRKLIDQRLLTSLGKDRYTITADAEGLITVNVSNQPLRNLDALRGLPIDIVIANGTAITDLESLRGSRIRSVSVANTKAASLVPLLRPALRQLVADYTPIRDWPLLKEAPLEVLSVEGTKVEDLSFAKGMPLRILNIKDTAIADLTPVLEAPLKELNIRQCKRLTQLASILKFTGLEKLNCDVITPELAALRNSRTLLAIDADAFPGEGHQGARSATEFWTAFDARKGAAPR